MTTLFNILLGIAALALVPAVARLAKGPTLADRVVALDVIAAAAVSMLSLLAVVHHLPVFIDLAVVLALVSFVGTVAFARYLEERRRL